EMTIAGKPLISDEAMVNLIAATRTRTGSAVPPSWMDLTPRVNLSLGGQAVHYPVGYKPTAFELLPGR
ncbi:MAG: hypothetical protein ABIR11_10745, partial [Candidatus Limnocylindrales bacterium]